MQFELQIAILAKNAIFCYGISRKRYPRQQNRQQKWIQRPQKHRVRRIDHL